MVERICLPAGHCQGNAFTLAPGSPAIGEFLGVQMARPVLLCLLACAAAATTVTAAAGAGKFTDAASPVQAGAWKGPACGHAWGPTWAPSSPSLVQGPLLCLPHHLLPNPFPLPNHSPSCPTCPAQHRPPQAACPPPAGPWHRGGGPLCCARCRPCPCRRCHRHWQLIASSNAQAFTSAVTSAGEPGLPIQPPRVKQLVVPVAWRQPTWACHPGP